MLPEWTPLKRSKIDYRIQAGIRHTFQRYQFPILPSTATTTHHVQGGTLHAPGVLDLGGGTIKNPGLHYTALSRFTKLEDVFILDFCDKTLHTSPYVKQEMKRMKDTRPVDAQGRSYADQPLGTIKVGHQNARSLNAHIPQLRTDPHLPYLDFLACTESNALETDPDSHFELPGFHMHRVNDGRGVRKSTSLILYVRDPHTFLPTLRIENPDYVIIKGSLSIDAGPDEQPVAIDIVSLYRRPSSSILEFLRALEPHVRDSTPHLTTVIIGDFNINLNNQDTATKNLTSLMHASGFT